jgi:pyruvate kinase
MRCRRKAKIVATLGPASSSLETIRDLVRTGVDVFRLNFSHGTHADHAERVRLIRQVETEMERPVGILMDLQGPKLRVGVFGAGPVQLVPKASFRLDLDPAPGDATRVTLPHPEIFAALKPGADLLLDDGKIRLEVVRCGADYAETRVRIGGTLSERKGVNVPGVVVPLSPLTEKDHTDLKYGLSLGADWIALSFVQRPEDVDEARRLVGKRAAIMVKLEKPAAIEHLDEIVERCDGVMVARGDLGVEMPPEQVPIIQKRTLRACAKAGKPVIVATQMLESMIQSPIPTRAEASDVATAVYDGADAVMLSAESASGKYPVEAVAMMDRIITQVERDPHYRTVIDAQRDPPEATPADAICAALQQTATVLHAACVITYTSSGFTSLRAARERPEAPILSLTPNIATARRLALVWGVYSALADEVEDVDTMVAYACRSALNNGFAKLRETVVIAAGMPFGRSGTTNLLRIARIRS